MDLKAKISIDSVTTKETHLAFSKQKQKKEDRSKYLDGILVSSGHQLKDTNQALLIHFYFFWEMIWTSSNLDVQIKQKKFIMIKMLYVLLDFMISLYGLIVISTIKVILN